MRRFRFDVRPGAVVLNDISVIRLRRGVYAITADAHTKYYSVGGSPGSPGYAPSLQLWATDRSLKVNPECDRNTPTLVSFPARFNGYQWHLTTEGDARYGFTAVLWRDPGRWRTWRWAWRDDDEDAS